MSKYADLDDRILSILSATPIGYMALADRTGKPWRLIDGRLQALRKRGLIVPNRNNLTWEIAPKD